MSLGLARFSRLIQRQLAIGVVIDARKKLFHGGGCVSACQQFNHMLFAEKMQYK